MEKHKVIIIGGGPCGLTAAIYASRANLAPLVIEGVQRGGQLMNTTDVENYPAFPSILGPELVGKMREQAAKFGTTFLSEDVASVKLKEDKHIVRADGKDYVAEALIIATGAQPRRLGLPEEKSLWGKGVTYCATCDGFFYKDKDIVVVGGGDAAMEEAIFMTKFAKSVTVLVRSELLKASKIMADRANANKKIKFMWNVMVSKIVATPTVSAVELTDVKTNKKQEFKTQGVFVAIGHIPSSDLFKGQVEMNDLGYILTKNNTTVTSKPGVFAAGDVVDHRYRQAITAAGTGCMAAIDAERYLSSKEH